MLMNSSDEGHDHSPPPHPWQTQTIHLFEHEREPMFQKPLTPSDVGKLNRLVIPKQHAEKYFPLDTTTTSSSSTMVSSSTSSPSSSSGLLLSFEDETGKCWRFRYSYWNSSQSYVLTKGWSRYVKEKRLDAGDVVLFERCRGDEGRLFIGWRRRGATTAGGGAGGGGFGWCYGEPAAASRGCYQTHLPLGLALPYSQLPVNQGQRTPSSNSTPTGNSRTLRLFGVNLECQLDEPSSDPQSSDDSPMSSSQGPSPTYRYFDYVNNHPHADHHNHMDINFQMGNRLG